MAPCARDTANAGLDASLDADRARTPATASSRPSPRRSPARRRPAERPPHRCRADPPGSPGRWCRRRRRSPGGCRRRCRRRRSPRVIARQPLRGVVVGRRRVEARARGANRVELGARRVARREHGAGQPCRVRRLASARPWLPADADTTRDRRVGPLPRARTNASTAFSAPRILKACVSCWHSSFSQTSASARRRQPRRADQRRTPHTTANAASRAQN